MKHLAIAMSGLLIAFGATAAPLEHPRFGRTPHPQACPQKQPGLIAATDMPRLLGAYPNGGEGLTGEVENLLERDSADAIAIVQAARRANEEQKAAIALAFLRALRVAQVCDRDGARALRAALRAADPTLAAIFAALEAQYRAEAGLRGDSMFYPGAAGGFATGSGGSARPISQY